LEQQAKGYFMAEQDSNYSADLNCQNKGSAGKIKLSARELWNLIWPISLGALGILMIISSINPPK
jgi:hypothetical protein